MYFGIGIVCAMMALPSIDKTCAWYILKIYIYLSKKKKRENYMRDSNVVVYVVELKYRNKNNVSYFIISILFSVKPIGTTNKKKHKREKKTHAYTHIIYLYSNRFIFVAFFFFFVTFYTVCIILSVVSIYLYDFVSLVDCFLLCVFDAHTF